MAGRKNNNNANFTTNLCNIESKALLLFVITASMSMMFFYD